MDKVHKPVITQQNIESVQLVFRLRFEPGISEIRIRSAAQSYATISSVSPSTANSCSDRASKRTSTAPHLSARQQNSGISTHTLLCSCHLTTAIGHTDCHFPFKIFPKCNSAIRPNVQFSPASDLSDPTICLRDRCSPSHSLLPLIKR
jgi:hypothetical protein